MTDDLYQFVVADYSATGEGRTVMLLITRAFLHSDDYDSNFTLKEGCTPKLIAAKEFIQEFGEFYSIGAEYLMRDEFLDRYGAYLPEYVKRILNAEGDQQPGNFHFKQSLHINFS